MQINLLSVGVVIIGRNEGLRLITCLDSLAGVMPRVVYVDSASTDNSVVEAKKRRAHVVSLDMSHAFTAARARNAGFDAITSVFPDIKFVQFVDGDCEVLSGWIQLGMLFLENNPHVAVVSGVLNERFPEQSIYNFLCDAEWKASAGEIKYCGGNALMRADAFKAIGGFLPNLIAGEEPELCVRLRQSGWKIWHLDESMMLHDANITSFFQWWKRTTRAGYAYAEGALLHGAAPEFHWVAESRRAWIWGFILPVLIFIMCFLNLKLCSLMILLYPLQVTRLALRSNKPKNWQKAFFLVLGKFAEMIGQFKFFKQKYFNEEIHLIEYK